MRGIDATYKGVFYVGTWTSNLDFSKLAGDTSTDEEVDIYGGWRPAGGRVQLRFRRPSTTVMWTSPRTPRSTTRKSTPRRRAVFGPLTLGASIFYSDQYSYHAGKGYYGELNGAYTIDPKWSLSGAVGYQKYDDLVDAASYTTWNLGVTYAVTSAVSLDLRYYDTDAHGFYGDPAKAHVVAALKATF